LVAWSLYYTVTNTIYYITFTIKVAMHYYYYDTTTTTTINYYYYYYYYYYYFKGLVAGVPAPLFCVIFTKKGVPQGKPEN
jgi:hypothetical protein